MAKIDHISYGGTSYEIVPAAGDLRDIVAPEFSDQSTYTAGQMVLKNGVLYRFTAAHAGAWTGTDVEVVTVGGEVTDLKADLNHSARVVEAISTPVTTDVTGVRTESTYINTQGVVVEAIASFYTYAADVTAGREYVVNGYAAQNCYLYIFTDSNGNTIHKSDEKGASGGTNYSGVLVVAPANAAKLIVDGNVGGTRPPAYIGTLDKYIPTDSDKIPTAETAIIPSIFFPHYPVIDSVNKKITIPRETIIVDKRTSNGNYYVLAETQVVDYSDIASSTLKVYYDVSENTFVASVYTAVMDASKRLLFMLVRTSDPSPNHITISAGFPVIIDGMTNGVVHDENTNVKSINHRGLMQYAPENTLVAFSYSKMAGFDAVETDVRFTSDGVPVLLHDATINRTARNADGSELQSDVNIADITYAQALTYDFGIYKGAQFAGARIPSFEQFIKTCRKLGLRAYIELKTGTEEQIKSLYPITVRNGMKGKCSWISYSLEMLTYIHTVAPGERLGYLASAIRSDDIIGQLVALRQNNEVFYELDTADGVTDEGIARLISVDVPLELYTGSISSIVNADPYITGFTSSSFIGGKELSRNWSL